MDELGQMAMRQLAELQAIPAARADAICALLEYVTGKFVNMQEQDVAMVIRFLNEAGEVNAHLLKGNQP